MFPAWLVFAGIAVTAQDVIHYSSEYNTFLHQVWQFFRQSTPGSPLASWTPIENWMDEKFYVLAFEENYAFVIDHFCESANVTSTQTRPV